VFGCEEERVCCLFGLSLFVFKKKEGEEKREERG
jgi:hypothetical protein